MVSGIVAMTATDEEGDPPPVTLRTVKRFGWLVGDGDRATGEVVAPVVIGDEVRRP